MMQPYQINVGPWQECFPKLGHVTKYDMSWNDMVMT
jgi:hypothetical protein